MKKLSTQAAFLSVALAALVAPSAGAQETPPPFKGIIKLDVRDSKPDWAPYLPRKAPKGAPNVLFILYDDTGQASWSPYGGRINMPTLQKLADSGLTYTQWHTTALCSPTRSTLLTGRNHHVNTMAAITEGSNGFPGANCRLPDNCATVGQVLQDAGWSTFWLGKNHNVAEQEVASGASRKLWPLQKGFDRFYGFLGGETNQWYPDLVNDNHFIEAPATPAEGYHLSKDLADQAISMIRDQQGSNPSRPWFMWYCPGANHAPHHCPQDYIDKYKGKFDDGYEAYRAWVLPRMIEKGILPQGTQATPINPLPKNVAMPPDMVRPWDTLDADAKKLFARQAEVFAGYSEYTDVQIGRVLDYLKASGQYDNTMIIYAADNGASGEGTPNGSVNENKFFNGYPDSITENLKYYNVMGGPDTYEHYATGWAVAFSTPYQMFKRYANYAGGTCDPLVISWPKGIQAHGELRKQYHHSTDIVPTILDVCGVKMPKIYHGVKQAPLNGVSMRYTFGSAQAPTHKKRQYYAMLGTRAIWEDGWKAVAVHAAISNAGHFEQDQWQLYHVDVDPAESKDLAKENPQKLEALKKAWFEEANKNQVLPIDDRDALTQLNLPRPLEEPPRDSYVYYPGTSAVPEGVAVNVRNRSYKIVASVEITDPNCQGVIFAHGSRFGGHTLFIKNKKLHYVYNFLGIQPEQQLVSAELKPGKYVLGMEFIRESAGQYHESLGQTRLYVNEQMVAQGPMRTQPGKFTLSGDGLCVGWDSADAVSKEYQAPARFQGGTINSVNVCVGKEEYLNLEKEAQRAFSRE